MADLMDQSIIKNAIFFEKMIKGVQALARTSQIQYQYNERQLVYQHDKVKLYHYQPKVKNRQKTPLLVVFATVNRPEILDIFPEQSFIYYLLQSGVDVYLLDWGYPDKKDHDIGFEHYITNYLKSCVAFIREHVGADKINLLGICQGALLCLLYSLIYHDIKKLVLISCPIDFHTQDNLISHLFRRLDVDVLTKTFGNVSGAWLTQFFISLRPFELIGKKYLKFIDHIEEEMKVERFLQVEKWLNDAPDQTCASFRELITAFYQENKLVKGTYRLGDKQINISSLNIPVLNVMAKYDEIVPVSASRPLKKYIDPKLYSQRYYPSGHIGIYVSDKVGKAMPRGIAKWLK